MNHTEVTEKNDNIKIRLVVYLIGLFIMTLGISMSVKSNLGVSPDLKWEKRRSCSTSCS